MKKFKESVHQEFERYLRDEMDDIEKEMYSRTDRYKKLMELIEITLRENKKD